jgi:hypothetical protein
VKLVLVGVASLALFGCRVSEHAQERAAGSASAERAQARSSTAPAVLIGRVLDGHGAPIAGVEVQLFSGMGTLCRNGTTRTDAEGRYRFEIEHAAMRHDEATQRWIGMMWLATQHDRFASSDGESMWQVDVPLERGVVVERDFAMVEAGAIEGVLLQATTGAPIAENLRIFTGGPNAMHFLRYATADERGRFAERGLFPGVYTIDVNSGNLRYPILGTVRVEAGKTAKVELRWDEAGVRSR